MDLTQFPLFQAMSGKLRWISQNQTVLSENIANADTPGYAARELSPFTFRRALHGHRMAMARTESGHIAVSGGAEERVREERKPFEVSPSGNAVVLEEQVMKAADNAMDHQLVTGLYRKHLGMLRMALRGGGTGEG
jgi:flagellar basal-body rod protein FlgB